MPLQSRPAGALALAFFAAAVLGCAAAPKPKKDFVWPSPPDAPRIRFVKAFARTSDLEDSSTAQLLRTIFGADPGPAVGKPMGLALSEDGQRLYIADAGRRALLVADLQAKRLSKLADADVVGIPHGVALDADENVYVIDQPGQRVVVLSKTGEFLRALGKEGNLIRPPGVAVDPKRRLLYVSDPARKDSPDHRVLTFTFEGRLVRTLGSGKGGADAQFYFPLYLTVDSEGLLYVGDAMNFRIQVFSPDGKFLRKHGSQGDGPGTFARIKGLTVDSHGILYAVESEYAVVQMFRKDDFVPLMYFGCNAAFLECLSLPSAITVDPRTNLIYVANQTTPRINVYELLDATPDEISPPGEQQKNQ